MSLTEGTRLGTYEIIGKIGAGGMGEVYRATDTKLDREVAIKILPAALVGDKDRLARFEREAKLLAVLNHANIASVYALDDQDGTVFIAMELVEGETLAAALERGPLTIGDALQVALQIASALEAAHEKGVVHRDLKPANVMLTPEGSVKVLDFGLAKAFMGNPNEASPAHSPALSVAMTQQGLVLGTAGYMAPEQASGQATDQRADVWAFGVLLYEMLTGQPVFSGETVPHILAAVLQTEPNWERLPDPIHPRLKLVLERCLTKRPRSRLHSIADVRIELEAVLADPTGASLARSDAAAAIERRSPLFVSGIAVASAVIAAFVGWQLRPVPEPEAGPIMRFSMPMPDDQSFSADPVSMIAVSPDGTRIAYVANNQLYQRNLAESEARPVAGTRDASRAIGAAAPAYSPDGQWLAYLDVAGTNGPYEIKRVPTSGGAPVLLHSASELMNLQHGLSWPTTDSILFANAEGIVRIPANGGATEVLVPRGEDERFFSPQLLPDLDAVLFTVVPGAPPSTTGYEQAEVAIQSIGSNERTVVWQGGTAAHYVPTGHLVYAQGSALFAIAFDPAARAVSGGPVPLMDGLRRSGNGFSDAANFGIAATGTLAYIPGLVGANLADGEEVETTVVWVDRDGREEPLPIRPDDYTHARVSPDGTQIALVVGAGLGRQNPPSIWIYNSETRNLRLMATEPPVQDGPVWSADGRRLYFRSLDAIPFDIQVIDLETGEITMVTEGVVDGFPLPLPWSLSPDEQTLAIINAQSETDVDVATVDLTNGQATRMLFGEGAQNEPSISPNGAWLAVAEAPPGGESQINIRPFPNVFRTVYPVGPGNSPVFSRDGTQLFFQSGPGVFAAPIEYEPTIRVGTPSPVFQSDRYMWNLFGRTWDPDPSGERFIVPRLPNAPPVDAGTDDGVAIDLSRVDVVANWFEELKARVPTD